MELNELRKHLLFIPEGELWLDFSEWIVHDEFHRPEAAGKETDYRNRAIDRLVASGHKWHTESNIAPDVIKRFVRITCPYCNKQMEPTGYSSSSGGGPTCSEYACSCGVRASIAIDEISFDPARRTFEDGDNG